MLRAQRISTIGAVTLALAVPTAAGARQDLRSPDAADPPPVVSVPRDRGRDLRTPDAKDATQPRTTVTPVVITPSAREPQTGFQWSDAGIGAAGMLGIVVLVAGVALLTSRRRHERLALPTH